MMQSRCVRAAILYVAMAVPIEAFMTMQQRPPGLAQPVWRHSSQTPAQNTPAAAGGALAPVLLSPSRSLLTKRAATFPPPPPGRRRFGPEGKPSTRVGARSLSGAWFRDADETHFASLTRPQLLILASMTAYAFIALYVGVGPLLADGLPSPLKNLPTAIMCFGGADLFSQAYERVKSNYRTMLDLQRVFAACMVGVICNALGLPVWLYFLDNIIPKAVIGLQGLAAVGKLVLKAFMHSLIWGTISNSISLVLRRLLTGDSVRGSVAFWHDKILTVTSRQIFFWPTFMCFNFAVVPAPLQIQATAMAAFVFNVFISIIAAAPPRPVEQETFDLIKAAMTTDAVEPNTFELVQAAMSAPAVPEHRLEEALENLLSDAGKPVEGTEDEKELLRSALAAPIVEDEDAELIKVAMKTAAVSEETFEVVAQALAEPAVEEHYMDEVVEGLEAALDAVPTHEAEAAEELIKAALAASPAVSEGAPTETIVIT